MRFQVANSASPSPGGAYLLLRRELGVDDDLLQHVGNPTRVEAVLKRAMRI
jgi:hypothetical protein